MNRHHRPLFVSIALLCLVMAGAPRAADPARPSAPRAVAPIAPERIRFVHMGGNDCPPCVQWRATELPLLQQSPVFQDVHFSYVVKSVRSPVPAEAFLPAELKPLKARLDLASGGRGGSPHQALLVDDAVVDYWFGPLAAAEIEARIVALRDGARYPGKRCLRREGGPSRRCAEPA